MPVKTLVDDGKGSIVVVWASRHEPLKAQIHILRSVLGKIKVIQVSGVIPSAEWLAELALKHDAGIVVPVLPLSFVARLSELQKKYGFIVLWAEMEEIARTIDQKEAEKLVEEKPEWRTAIEYSGGIYRIWEFKEFRKVIKVQLVTEPFPNIPSPQLWRKFAQNMG